MNKHKNQTFRTLTKFLLYTFQEIYAYYKSVLKKHAITALNM